MKRKELIMSYIFILPAFLLVVIFLLIPVVQNIYFGFFQWNGITDKIFIGLQNYLKFFSDDNFIRSITNTLLWVIFTIIFPVSISLLVAVFVRGIKGGKFFRTIFIIPITISFVSTGAIWLYMFSREYGLLNEILLMLGFKQRIAWLFSIPLNTFSMMIAWFWQQLGGNLILFLMGLTSIPKETVEASIIDGCSRWQTFRYITFPLLKPITTVVVGMAIINSFKAFDIIFLMTRGGPIRSSETLAVTMFREAFQMSNLGYGAAISVFLTILILPISIIYIKTTTSRDRLDYK